MNIFTGGIYMSMILLVDENNFSIGYEEKIVHEKALLHRAFSVLLFNQKGQMLIQKRAKEKYHSGEKWANPCCSHQEYNETLNSAIMRCCKNELNLFLPHFLF